MGPVDALLSAVPSERLQSDGVTHRSRVTRPSTGEACRISPESENLESESQNYGFS